MRSLARFPAATVAAADAIFSWNFKHIVRLDRIRRYNEVNRQHGYEDRTIVSPKEMRFDEDDLWQQFPPIPGFDCLKMNEEVHAAI